MSARASHDDSWTQPWGGTNRTWHRKGVAYYYGVFWHGMPDLNYDHAPVREEAKKVATFWLQEMGVARVFTPGATTHEIVDWVRANVGDPATAQA
mgnify:CR=1 FL=1